ncbi:putative 3-hydroxyisobutyrate dehydrogenase [Microbacterium sp. C448]|uniref:NAD(P)-dependent oxidoreductase n=1 Tax=Microbacterium sp. C448 TaxID=1177594 RepID=UPI0003DE11E9|nr:NAD(P)-dependent oxidoreductase [Microbacterium sp. C448]CDJ99074.1 putative 3-hydroxyisobutyrate dehydrogenase [Microbacterium sp. C448]
MPDSTIGFIGLGAMGEPMARNASSAGLRVVIYDANPAALERAASWGATVCDSLADLAQRSTHVVTVLPADGHVRDVVGELIAANPVLTILDFSTIGPWTFMECAHTAEEAGGKLLAGALTRGVEAAQAGTLALYLDDVVREDSTAMSVVDAISSSVTFTGGAGTAKTVKLLNNLVVGVNVALIAEVLTVGEKAGIDPAALLGALTQGSSNSFAMRSHFVRHALAGDLGAGKFSTQYMLKDLRLVSELARRSGQSALFGGLATSMYRGTIAIGHGDSYYPAVWYWTNRAAGFAPKGDPS